MNLTTVSDVFKVALQQAVLAAEMGEVPVGAVVAETATGKIITVAHNLVEQLVDPTAHAEMLALRAACTQLGTTHLEAYTLVVTLEPCAMCAQAMAWARVGGLVFGAYDPKSGGVDHGARVFQRPTCHHQPVIVGGVQEEACGAMLRQFFQSRRT